MREPHHPVRQLDDLRRDRRLRAHRLRRCHIATETTVSVGSARAAAASNASRVASGKLRHSRPDEIAEARRDTAAARRGVRLAGSRECAGELQREKRIAARRRVHLAQRRRRRTSPSRPSSSRWRVLERQRRLSQPREGRETRSGSMRAGSRLDPQSEQEADRRRRRAGARRRRAPAPTGRPTTARRPRRRRPASRPTAAAGSPTRPWPTARSSAGLSPAGSSRSATRSAWAWGSGRAVDRLVNVSEHIRIAPKAKPVSASHRPRDSTRAPAARAASQPASQSVVFPYPGLALEQERLRARSSWRVGQRLYRLAPAPAR